MKYLILIIALLVCKTQASGQNVGEIFVNNENVSHEIWLNELFTDSSKVSIFNYTRFKVSYQDNELNEFISYSTLNYSIHKGFGIAGGGYVTAEGFAPVVALSYFYQDNIWLVNIFPTYVFANQEAMEVFLFLQYKPRLSDNLRFFSQLIVNSNFNFKRHNFSEQNLRVGLEYRSFQFGIGSDFTQSNSPITEFEEGVQTNFNQSIGIFLRKEF